MLNVIMQRMAENGASDAFISAGAPIYFKINGQVVPVNKHVMEPNVIKEMAYGSLSERQVKAFEESPDINFSIVLPEQGNFRFNMFRQRNTIALSIRRISFEIPSLEVLEIPTFLNDQIMEKRGLILMVGGTGVGKSTTLAAMINHRIANHAGHILTLEDPVEFLFKHGKSIVNQRDIGQDSNSYHEALRSAMRQSPDCLLIGEIRDQEAMTAALNVGLSGHLCVATLHANNSYQALTRIINMYPMEARQSLMQDLSVGLKSIIAQRLILDKAGKRIPIIEIMTNGTHVRELIENGEIGQIREAMDKSFKPDLQTFDRALLRLYEAGRIDRDTALEHADSPTNLSLMVNNSASAVKRPPSGDGAFDGFKLIYNETP